MNRAMRQLRGAALALLAAGVLTSAGCAASSSMMEDPGQPYGVNVVNTMPHPMIVSVDDGTSTRLLGTVGADRAERFVLHGVQGTVTIVAHDEGETHTVRRTVVLEAGGTVDVRL